jgi:phage shock protein C
MDAIMSKLYRSRTDRKITGLCGGLADTLRIDSNLLRLLLVVTTFFSGGVVIPLYFLAVIVIPNEPYPEGPYGYGPGPGPGYEYGGWNGAEASWGGKRWEKHWRKQERCRSRHDRHDERREYEGRYSQSGSNFQGQPNPGQSQGQGQAGSDLDEMMKDIEKKAMWKEIEELRAKVANYEKQQQQTKGDV